MKTMKTMKTIKNYLPFIAMAFYSSSLLGQLPTPPPTPTPIPSILTAPLDTPAKISARAVIQSVQDTKTVIIGQLRHSYSVLWDSPNPQAVLDELGTKASQVFLLNTAITQFCAQLLSEAGDTESLAILSSLAAKVPPYQINNDGTITLNPKPAVDPNNMTPLTPVPTPTPIPAIADPITPAS